MDRPTRAFVVPPGGGRSVRAPAGGPTLIKAGAAETGGAITAIENVVFPGQGTPLHHHIREDEMWWVLDGDFRFRAGEELFAAPQGSLVFVPRGVDHAFQNIGSVDGRLLVLFMPSGMEGFFEQHAALPAGPVDPETLARIARDNGMVVTGPPLAESDPSR